VDDLLELAEILTSIIDYKSSFTASHSRGVAAAGGSLAQLLGLDEDQCRVMRFSGLLHDIGKLAVPSEIIEKRAQLSDAETNRMRSHAYETWKAFGRFRGLDEARDWASRHHEHLDGSGYPFRLTDDQLGTGDRILAVADVYTALAENRPYRPGMMPSDAVGLIRTMVKRHCLDGTVVAILAANVSAVDHARRTVQAEAADRYLRVVGPPG
jgi:putative nucleotidyltransferase with HDIG domain